MNKLWIDIEEYLNSKYHIGYLIVDNEHQEIRGCETVLGPNDNIDYIIIENNIDEIYIFNENDSSYLKNKLLKNINCRIVNVSDKYHHLLKGTNLQLTKNVDIARAAGINVNYDRLHNPLYDIQLSYCAYHNFKISSVDKQQDMLYDSFFVFTSKFNMFWSLIKSKDVSIRDIDLKIIRPIEYKSRYFLDCSNLNNNEVSFIDYDTNEKTTIHLSRNTIQKLIEMFYQNIIIYVDSGSQKELSLRVWTILYEDNKRQNDKSFKTPLYIFLGINLARFKTRLQKEYSIDKLKQLLDNELSIENIKRINSSNNHMFSFVRN